MSTRQMILSCNLLLTVSIVEEGEDITVVLDDARHASIGYATGEKLPEEIRAGVGRQAIRLGLQALMDRFDADSKEAKPEVALIQKGADA